MRFLKFSTMILEKHLDAFTTPKGILLYEKDPYSIENVVKGWSLSLIDIWLYPKYLEMSRLPTLPLLLIFLLKRVVGR
jgi:hypothetical protein